MMIFYTGLNTRANRMNGKYYRNEKFSKSITRVFSFHKYEENNCVLSLYIYIYDAREIEKVQYKNVFILRDENFLSFVLLMRRERGTNNKQKKTPSSRGSKNEPSPRRRTSVRTVTFAFGRQRIIRRFRFEATVVEEAVAVRSVKIKNVLPNGSYSVRVGEESVGRGEKKMFIHVRVYTGPPRTLPTTSSWARFGARSYI